ncbi:sugar transporter SWEET1-like [Anopheles bellator]|uniref:sugar transporter SWEET1-like n=1 Tax=Anopheles bellator TaxID=139047 RepID=UPI0026477AA3|nr:sugar transporter SWEET1-like [Anopheles bellator]XP_058064953.1 sugar transporter SWEET1-like [Anopheles bellator]
MDSIGVALQPYKDTVGLTAAIVTVVQFFGGVLAINEIRRRGSTAGFSVEPFLGGTAFCLLNVQFGQMLRDDGMIRVNFIGLVLHIGYVCAFYLYTDGPRKGAVWGRIGLAGALTVGVLSYVQYEDPKVVEFRFGMILTALLWTLVGMPLLGLGEILKNKSTAGLPLPMILLGSIVSFMWLLYGIILRSNFLVVQNLVALALCAVQLSLFIIFPAESLKPPPSPAKKLN